MVHIIKAALLALFTLVVFSEGAVAQRLIAQGETWRYYKGRTSGPPNDSNGRAWTQASYDDSTGWGSGASGFGYGDGDDATVFSDMQQNVGAGQPGYLTVFIRKTFAVSDPAAVTRLTLAIDYDDGFVLHVNGVEVTRANLPAAPAPVVFNTAASGHEASRGESTANPQERSFVDIPPSLLVAGTNVVAISGHNSSVSSTDFSLIPELYAGVNLLRGPYLQMPTQGALTIVWRTDAPTDSAVDYGHNTDYTGGTISDAALVREHEITIPNLTPGKYYFYRVRSGGVTLAEAVFRGIPAAGQPFSFTVVGDFGYANAETTTVAQRIAQGNHHLMLTVGDNIYNPVGSSGTGQPGVYDQYWFTPYAAAMRSAPIFPALGNHDIETANGVWFLNYFRLPQNGPVNERERNYSFDYGTAHFAVIDSNVFTNPYDEGRAAAVKEWLAADLAATTQRWKFVVAHHPAYTSSGPGVHGPEVTLQNEIQPICAQYGVQIVFQGHNHFYERINPIDGVHYVTTGAGGRSLTHPTVIPTYSDVVRDTDYSFTRVNIEGGRLTLLQIGMTFTLDKLVIDLDHPFKVDGLLDSPDWERAANGLKLHAAIRGNYLYVATQDAGEGSDHFIYLSRQRQAMRAANWSKAGQVMQWSYFLADENDSGFKGWFGLDGGYFDDFRDTYPITKATSGINNNGIHGNGVLEGTVLIPQWFPNFGSFPSQIYVAAAPFSSADGGALVSGSQVPAGNGDGNIDPEEFLALNPRDIALDLPTSDAGPDQSVEAGMEVTLTGTGTAPSGMRLSYAWTQLTGPAFTINNANQPVASFTPEANVTEPTDVTLRLRVNDTRFDTDDTVVVELYPMVDSDGDGLSDQEELTGANNRLTSADPAGQITNPNAADTDGDGVNDGDEALAGTNPNSVASRFTIVALDSNAGSINITASSVAGRTYQLQRTANLAGQWSDVGEPSTALGPTIAFTVPVSGATEFYRVRLVP